MENRRSTFITINNQARINLGLTFDEYCLAQMVYNLTFNPKNERGYCFAERSFFIKELGVSQSTIQRAIIKLVKKGLVEKLANNKLKGTEKWYELTMITTSGQNDQSSGQNDQSPVVKMTSENGAYNVVNNTKIENTPPTPPQAGGNSVSPLPSQGSTRRRRKNDEPDVSFTKEQSDEYIRSLIEDNPNHAVNVIIGSYFKQKQMVFASKKGAEREAGFCRVDAAILAKFPPEKVEETVNWIMNQDWMGDKWTLKTVVKYISRIESLV